MAKKIEVEGISVSIEQIREEDYISLTDIAKKSDSESKHLIISLFSIESIAVGTPPAPARHNHSKRLEIGRFWANLVLLIRLSVVREVSDKARFGVPD